MTNGNAGPGPDIMRMRYGFWIVVIGFAVVLLALVLAIKLGEWKDVKDVTTLLSAVTGIVGGLAGAFFGVHVGAAGKEQANAERREAQRQLLNFAASAPPEIAKRALNIQD
jgi:hypothetical protein